jgi:hypothetical protein
MHALTNQVFKINMQLGMQYLRTKIQMKQKNQIFPLRMVHKYIYY